MKIAISGKMGSGKTTLANYLIEKHGFTHASFAKELKNAAMDIFGLSYEEAHGAEKDRELLQAFGEAMRDIKSTVWVDKVLSSLDDDKDYVLDDMRHLNEHDAMEDAGFLMVRLEAPEDLRRERLGERFKNPNHISETALDNSHFPIVVENIGSLESLYTVAETIYQNALKAREIDSDSTSSK